MPTTDRQEEFVEWNSLKDVVTGVHTGKAEHFQAITMSI